MDAKDTSPSGLWKDRLNENGMGALTFLACGSNEVVLHIAL